MHGYARQVSRVLLVVGALNLVVAVGKVAAGAFANSLSVMGDGFHSGIDALHNGVALLLLRFATMPADEDHPFGHAKYETLGAFAISGVLLLTAFELAQAAVGRLLAPEETVISGVTLAVLVATLLVNVGVSTWEARMAKRHGSDILEADAAHTRSDVFVTGGVLVGVGFTRMGVAYADGAVALVVAGFIAWIAYTVFRQALPILTDRVVHDPVDVARVVRSVPGVLNVHDIRSRGVRRASFVQMHLVVDTDDVARAHAITDEVERRVSEELGVTEVFVHVEPEDDDSGPPGSRGEPARS